MKKYILLFLVACITSCTNTECVSTRKVKTFHLVYDQSNDMHFPESIEVEVCDQHIITNLPERKQKKSLTEIENQSINRR